VRRPPREYGKLTPELLVRAYAAGIFPMAESGDDPTVYWVDPPVRGIVPIERFHVPRRLARTVRGEPFGIRCDRAFAEVMRGCAESTESRPETWINDEIRDAYTKLHGLGLAHSVECWRGDDLVGGCYGVALGGVFFGESMFSRATDASKVALVQLAVRLVHGGFRLMDVQFVTPHLRQFGAVEVPSRRYLQLLADALPVKAHFQSELAPSVFGPAFESLTQSSTQMS
jgi:leucyl/phenylalanyl-tRNA--protein transferase